MKNKNGLCYGSPPPQLFFSEIADFTTSPRPYILKYGGVPCRPDVVGRQSIVSFANEKICEDMLS